MQTDARAKPARPEVGTANGASSAGSDLSGSTGRCRRTRGRSPHALKSAPQAAPQALALNSKRVTFTGAGVRRSKLHRFFPSGRRAFAGTTKVEVVAGSIVTPA